MKKKRNVMIGLKDIVILILSILAFASLMCAVFSVFAVIWVGIVFGLKLVFTFGLACFIFFIIQEFIDELM